jgi:general stress protein YciG
LQRQELTDYSHRREWQVVGEFFDIVNNRRSGFHPPIKKRGFASLSLERRREIAAKGGAAVPAAKRSFSRNRELAVKAGAEGGAAVKRENRTFSKNRSLASEAGRKGGVTPDRKIWPRKPDQQA